MRPLIIFMKFLWKLKKRFRSLLTSLKRISSKTVEERKADGMAAISEENTNEAINVRCIPGKNALTIQLLAKDNFELRTPPETSSTLQGLRILNHTPKSVTMGYLFTERTPKNEHVQAEIQWSAQSIDGKCQEGLIRVEFKIAKGGKPSLLSLTQ